MDTTNQPLPHLALRAAKKLNPKLQCWRWNDDRISFFTYELGCWIPVGAPKWLPHCIYAVTSNEKEKPSWAPSQQQLKDASSLKERSWCEPELSSKQTALG